MRIAKTFLRSYLFVFDRSVNFNGQVVSRVLPEDSNVVDVEEVLVRDRLTFRNRHYRHSCWNVLILTLPVRDPVLRRTPHEVSEN